MQHEFERNINLVIVPNPKDAQMLQEIFYEIECTSLLDPDLNTNYTVYWTRVPPFLPYRSNYKRSILPGVPGEYDNGKEIA